MDEQKLRITHYALLIGIDAYPEKPLKGCVRDVCTLKRHVDKIPKPSIVHTRAFTASLAKDSIFLGSFEDPCSLPTRDNVVEALKWIISEAQDGDFVYIHFSGHGTAFRPERESGPSGAYSNRSTGDLALVLLQGEGTNIQYLRGFEFASLLTAMVNRKLIVTVVLDCCFSGSVVRKGASVRYLDYNPQVDSDHPHIPEDDLEVQSHYKRVAYRNSSMQSNWLTNPEGYTIFTACGPSEIAKEIQVGHHVHGALSYFLTETFEKLGGIGGLQQYIYQSLRARFCDIREKYGHSQNPMFYGSKNLCFFGLANSLIGPVPIPVSKSQSTGFRLEAGRAHGIFEGDTFTVASFSRKSSPKRPSSREEDSVMAKATSVRGLTSCLKVSSIDFREEDTELFATPCTQFYLQKYAIRLDRSISSLDINKKALQLQRLRLCETYDATTNTEGSFLVVQVGSRSYEIWNEMNHKLLDVPVVPNRPDEDTSQVLDALKHLIHFKFVKDIMQDPIIEYGHHFHESFNIQLIQPGGDKISPGCLHAGQYGPGCLHSECLAVVKNNTALILEVENKEKEGGHPICVHVYALSPSWEISNILRADYEVIPPRSSNQSDEFRKGSSGLWRKKLRMTIPLALQDNGAKQCDDTIKVFLTSRPTSLLSLELPDLGKPMERVEVSSNRVTGAYSPHEEWAVLTFQIRTCSE